MEAPANHNDLPEGTTHVRITCVCRSIEANVTAAQAATVSNYVSLVAESIPSEGKLLAFVLDQVDGRSEFAEAAIAAAHPGYAEDVAHKVMLFALGLLAKRRELAEVLHEALLIGGNIIDVQLTSIRAAVQINGRRCQRTMSFMVTDEAGRTPALH
ncbi:hypothetical protein [Ralstonia pseudosolanacearum]|uniref:hypothetical protein n=1 Tax=Ralstonia pseudosolanacearum TaxID=1310165 RepID=UPI00339677D9